MLDLLHRFRVLGRLRYNRNRPFKILKMAENAMLQLRFILIVDRPKPTRKIVAMNLTEVLAAIRAVLPFLKVVAALTPTPYDDQAVAWLEKFLANPNGALDDLTGGNAQKIEDALRGVLPLMAMVSHYLPFRHEKINVFLEFLTQV